MQFLLNKKILFLRLNKLLEKHNHLTFSSYEVKKIILNN